jgi:hypothetical protein
MLTSLGQYKWEAITAGQAGLVYIGEGSIRARLVTHMAKGRSPRDEQGRVFAVHFGLECSWMINNDWLPHQRLELENDLIAAYVLVLERIPPAQFLGRPGPLPESGTVE